MLRRLLALALLSAAGCAAADAGDVADHHEDGSEGAIASTSEALAATDPVSSAVAQSCSTTSVKGLATQLVEEIQCLRPGSMKSIAGAPGLSLGAAVFPYLQTPAANALVAAQKARGTTMSINSALRTLPQQYLLYRWYQTGRCGISLAARPGTSNHESALAVDIEDHTGWMSAMTSKGFQWLGASDPVHFDFVGGGTIDLHGLSVKAFQRLWNRNRPADTIAEDGVYGPATEARLAMAPVDGFTKGAFCKNADPDAGTKPDAGGGDPSTPSSAPEAPASPAAADPASPPPTTNTTAASLPAGSAPSDDASDGCTASPSHARGSTAAALFALGIALAAAIRRRRVTDPA